jgi:hypothetical protein
VKQDQAGVDQQRHDDGSDAERNRAAWSSRSMSRLRACWLTHAPVGWAVIPARWAAGAVLDHHQDVEAAEEDGVDVGEVDREDRVSLRRQELPPDRAVPLRCGAGSMPAVLRILQTVEAAIRWPSPTSSPWMRR